MQTVHLKISGMSCSSCAAGIERESLKNGVIESASVNFATESGKFIISDNYDEQFVINFLKEQGYGASLFSDVNPSKENQNNENVFLKFLIGIFLSILIFVLAMTHWGMSLNQKLNWSIQFLAGSVIMIFLSNRFLTAFFRFIKTGKSSMNTLIGLAISFAYLYSSLSLLNLFLNVFNSFENKVYFEAIGFIVSFIYLGQFLEEKAKRKAKEAMNDLMKMAAKEAMIVNKDGTTNIVEINKIEIGNIIRVKVGEKIPVDGIVTKGTGTIDESMISGEPIPVDKKNEDKVYSGTILTQGSIDIKATGIGEETFLNKIIQFVEEAQNKKPNIQKVADKISGIFVPIVILLALLTFASWYFLDGTEENVGKALSHTIALLVIACPCALGLATPTAVVVATGNAAKKGILISGGDTLEAVSEIKSIAFDKTGTLTIGKPIVEKLIIEESFDRSEVLSQVLGLELYSEHPLSKAIVEYCQKSGIKESEPDLFEMVAGKGIKGEFDSGEYIIGKKDWIDSTDAQYLINEQSIEQTASYICLNKKVIGLILFDDEIKPEAFEVVQKIRDINISPIMITGDNKLSASRVAQKVGISSVYSNVLPVEKAKIIEDIKKKSGKIAMIGDGINDAPALSMADISMAMGTGSDVAINSSDVTLIGGSLLKVYDFLKLGKKTLLIIKQNLFFSMIYNLLAIPLAAGALEPFFGISFPPALASFAMAMSSISVVLNSLRLYRY